MLSSDYNITYNVGIRFNFAWQLVSEVSPRHSLFQHEPAPKRLKSRNSFIHAIKSLDGKPHNCRIDDWSKHLQSRPHKVSRDPDESLPKGTREPWSTWYCLNHLLTGVGRCIHLMQKWVNSRDANIECDCGEDPQTMEHLLECPLLPEPCRPDDFAVYNSCVRACVLQWRGKV